MAQLTLALARPEFWLALGAAAVALALLAWRLRLAWRPAWLLRVALIAAVLAGLLWPRGELEQEPLAQPQVMVVDQSDSLPEAQRDAAWRQALDWRAAAENRLVVAVGVEARSALAQPDPARGYSLPQVDGRASDLAGGLRLAEILLAGRAGQVLLASDGLAGQPEAVGAAASELGRKGIRVDALPLPGRSPEGDLALGRPVAPANLWSGTDFDLFVPVLGETGSQAADLRLKVNGQEMPYAAEALGQGTYRFRVSDLPAGIVTLEVSVEPARAGSGLAEGSGPADEAAPPVDPFPENNTAYATLQVFPPPRALFVSAEPGREAVGRFLQGLGDHGVQVNAVTPGELPTNLNTMQGYQVIFLDNLLSSQLTQEQMRALQLFVARLAGGLVVLGGRNAYTLGGYQGSLLEPMLPVELEPPSRSMRPPMVFQLILDRSSSMEIGSMGGDDIPPIALAREAAMRAIETLREEDYLGVLTFSDTPVWDVPLRQVGGAAGLRDALDAVSRVMPNGGTQLFKAMEATLEGMAALPADAAPQNRHILMLSDGQSTDGKPDEFRRLAEEARAQGITISTIALGMDADVDLMESIAEAGEGRFYAVRDAGDLPRILISESEAARSENVQAGETRLKIGESGHPVLSGLSQRQLPPLNGYNALRSKAERGAEDVLLSSSFDDPLLSTWQYGLGRVSAWMGDLGDEWTGAWADPQAAGQFWSQVIRYGLVDPTLGPAQVSVDVGPARLAVEAQIFTRDGEPLNLSEAIFSYADAAGQVTSLRLPQTGPGSYRLELPRPTEGAYRGALEFMDETGQRVEAPAPFAVNPPEEWLPRDPAPGRANLEAWARASGGGVTDFAALLAPVEAAEEPQPLAWDDFWQRLMLALAILWPLEIAIRRRWLPWM